MRRKLLIILLLLIPLTVFATERVRRFPTDTPVTVPSVSEVEAKLDLDGGNANTTIDIGSQALTTSDTVTAGTLNTGTLEFEDTNMRFHRVSESILDLYVNNKLIHRWEDATAISLVLLETGDKLLLESGDNVIIN